MFQNGLYCNKKYSNHAKKNLTYLCYNFLLPFQMLCPWDFYVGCDQPKTDMSLNVTKGQNIFMSPKAKI